MERQPNPVLNHFIVEDSSLLTIGHTCPVELAWTSDQLAAEAATYPTNTIENPFPRRDSNPRSEQSNGCTLTPYTAIVLDKYYWCYQNNRVSCYGGRSGVKFGNAMHADFWWGNLTE